MKKEIKEKLSLKLAEYAQQSILYEAILTPKPGLVDAVDQGSHKDMNVFTFIDSSTSLFKSFYDYVEAGLSCEYDEKVLFNEIRKIGIEAEKHMFETTKNINTHKGINFSFGIILAASGYYFNTKAYENITNFNSDDSSEIINIVKKMTCGLVENDFKNIHKKEKENLTNGEKLYLKTGFSGIRGEVESGFPTVFNLALPRLRQTLALEMSLERKLLDVLFHIMSKSSDSNVVNRGGLETLEFVNQEANNFVENNIIFQDNYKEKIEEMNKRFKAKNISPGGSADLLSVTIYFALLESLL
ncbi:MAG: triphosphoribosyl-dephospho-CoA synthase CitG [Bacillota bacterium]|nr:triphosphoribosyl-dephospho-CoA synthase CitG [Bacillota bacterium]